MSMITLAATLCASTALATDGTSLQVAISDEHGPYVEAGNGLPVYMFDTRIGAGDGQTPLDSCNARCLGEWPLVTVDGDLVVDDEMDSQLAATVMWEGEEVAIYNSNALFYFYRDTAEGEPIGHGIRSFGGRWYLIAPDGTAISTD
ncbi:hypothetical protein [Yoonia litorea]|nr:hypothetical protein [Yoonia litorea]